MNAQRKEDTVDANEAAELFRCSPRHLVDRVSKQPGFPKPIKLRPLVWVAWRVLEFRDATGDPPVRRR